MKGKRGSGSQDSGSSSVVVECSCREVGERPVVAADRERLEIETTTTKHHFTSNKQ
jgi:hypothetical protein